MSSRHQKLLHRFLQLPKDFRWNEFVRVFEGFGYWQAKGGKTSGSRVRFDHDTLPSLRFHRPHPGNIVAPREMRRALRKLKERGQI